MRGKAWSKDDDAKLVELFHEGQFIEDIAQQLGRTRKGVEGYLRRNRGRLGLDLRDKVEFMKRGQGIVYKGRKPFEQEWLGCVPFGHWMITKPWTKSAPDA